MLACAAKVDILDKVDDSQSIEGTDSDQCMLTLPCYCQGLQLVAEGLPLVAKFMMLVMYESSR